MEKQITKNQHYIPQLLLREFADEKENIERCSTISCSSERKNIKDVAYRPYLYEASLFDANSLEDNYFGKKEPSFKRLLTKIAHKEDLPLVDYTVNILNFLRISYVRTPESISIATQCCEGNKSAALFHLLPFSDSNDTGGSQLVHLLDENFFNIEKYHIEILCSSSREFVLGEERPVCIAAIGKTILHTFLPVNPHRCIALFLGKSQGEYYNGKKNIEYKDISDNIVDFINTDIIDNNRHYIRRISFYN